MTFVWIMIPASFRTPGRADAYYPGDDAVDWIAEDAYNWNGCSAGKPTGWRSPAEVVAPFATWAEPHGKPLMLAEWGSVEDPAEPMRKAQWLRDGLAAARSWPRLKALSYFDASGTCYWRLDSSAAARQAFGDTGNDPAAHGRTSAFLVPSSTLGIAPLAVRLDGSRSTAAGEATAAGIARWTLDFGDGSAPVAGTGQPPADLVHTYAAGTYAARLSVTDAAGGVNQDERSITAAAAPVITGNVSDIAATSAVLRVWTAPQGYAATVRAEWGSTTGYGQQSPVTQVTPTFSTAALTFPLTGLTPATRYYARVTATSPAGTSVRVWTFDTPGAPAVTRAAATAVTASTATLVGSVHPHSLPTRYRYEWGTSAEYGLRADASDLAAATSAVSVKARLSDLGRQQTYHFRLVAVNAAGTAYGPDQVFTTR